MNLTIREAAATALWGRMGSCAAVVYRRFGFMIAASDRADCQSAAGYYPAPQGIAQVIHPHRLSDYDSLKRLKSASNPESGIVNYTYDTNGNVLTKTDARFTTSSGYDVLNRINHISFSDPKTPSVGFCYDGFPYVANQGSCGTTPVAGQWMRKTASAAWLTPR